MRIRKVLGVLSLLLLSVGLLACGEKKIEIGILQYAKVGALDQAREGFIEALKDGGYVEGENIKITTYNPFADSNNNASMAQTLVRKSDLMLGIATNSAVALKVASDEQNIDKPILFTAVTDPIEVQLIDSNEKPGGNVTGTNDMNPIYEQVHLARELLPMATKMGVIYSKDEDNSSIQVEELKRISKTLDLPFEIIETTANATNEIQDAIGYLVDTRKVDVVYIPTDNVMIENIGIINDKCTTGRVPIIIAEENEVPIIPGLSLSINYYDLGYLTGEMAVKILNKEAKPEDIPSVGLDNYRLVVNKTILESIGVTIPQSILDRADEEY